MQKTANTGNEYLQKSETTFESSLPALNLSGFISVSLNFLSPNNQILSPDAQSKRNQVHVRKDNVYILTFALSLSLTIQGILNF